MKRSQHRNLRQSTRKKLSLLNDLVSSSALSPRPSLCGQHGELGYLPLGNPEIIKALFEVGIDVKQAQQLFDILDYDESGELDAQEFIHGILRARGEAKAKDILQVGFLGL